MTVSEPNEHLQLRDLTEEDMHMLTAEQVLSLAQDDYDRHMSTRWGRFLMWLLKKTT